MKKPIDPNKRFANTVNRALAKMPSAMVCDHANESARGECPCHEDCYCRGRTCENVPKFRPKTDTRTGFEKLMANPSTKMGRWTADWFLSCGLCGEQDFIEGSDSDGRGRKMATRRAKELGWKLERARGFVCPKCSKGREL